MARPGNKRLASQTLVPDQQKKGTTGMWDEADDGSLADAEDEGSYQYEDVAQGMSPLSARGQPAAVAGFSEAIAGLRHPIQNTSVMFSNWPPVGNGVTLGRLGIDELRKGA